MALKRTLQWRPCLHVLITMIIILVEGILGSRDGHLSSYLKAVFRDGSGMALNQMVVSNESGTDFVYLGGVSTLYQLDMGLNLLRQESTVPDPCEPSDPSCIQCDDPCLYETKILEVAPSPVGKLIQCGGPEGKCELRNLMNISREFGYTVDSVVNDGLSVGVVAFRKFETPDMPKVFMYVATSITDPYYGRVYQPLTQRDLRAFYPQFVFQYSRRINRIIDSAVDYIQGISWKNYNFFIVHSGSEQSRLGRICSDNDEDDLGAYSEIILSCQSYGILQSAHIDVNDILYGVFTNGTHSALCSYTMNDIQEKFLDTTCGCVITNDPSCDGQGTEISYLVGDSHCLPRSISGVLTRQSIEENYQCGDADQPERFKYAQAKSSLEGNPLWTGLPGDNSSIITFHKENKTVALVITSSPLTTYLNKILVKPDNTGDLYETMDLEATGNVLNDVHIDQDNEELFILTTNELIKMDVINCSTYTFVDCIGSTNADVGVPFCGWCASEQKCSISSECVDDNGSPSNFLKYFQECTGNFELICREKETHDSEEFTTGEASTIATTMTTKGQFTTRPRSSDPACDTNPLPRYGLSSGASAGIAILVLLLMTSVIINVILFVLWRRVKSKPDCKVSMADLTDGRKTKSLEANDNMAYETVSGAEREYTSLQIGSVEPSSPLVGPEKVTFFNRLSAVGQGYFGEVWKGELRLTQGQKSVALRKLPDVVALKSITVLQTVKSLFELPYHQNIVTCLGYCQQECYILYEFISGGTLLSHLQTAGKQSQPTYGNVKVDKTQMDEGELLKFAWQIAKGMQFLASKKIIHGSLCAHDVLLTERKDCKLSDYGLVSTLFKKKVKSTRWSSPETMQSDVHSLEGDIWSFGIVLWEIVSLGAMPYPNMKFDIVQKEVAKGYKMPRPRHCDEEVYAIMTRCWETDGGNRSSFDKILNSLERILENTHDYSSLGDMDKDTHTYVSSLDM